MKFRDGARPKMGFSMSQLVKIIDREGRASALLDLKASLVGRPSG
jgi:hypothetical protein